MGLAVIVALGLFPPWLYGVDSQRPAYSVRAEVPAGYHWVFSPPPLPSTSENCRAVPALGGIACGQLTAGGYARLDYARLLVQWLMVLLVGGGMILLFAERRP